MNDIESLVKEIAKLGHNYQPGETTRRILSDKTIVPIIGPSAIGKNTIIETILKKNQSFGRSKGFTTRPRRDGEAADIYTFIPHTVSELDKIKNRLVKKELVQVAVFTTNMIYGSMPEDYQEPYVLIDFQATAMNDLTPLGFKRILPVALCAEIDQWNNWLKARMSEVGKDEFLKRMREAKMSLQWVIDNHESVHIQLNAESMQNETAQQIIDVCEGRADPTSQNLPIIKAMLSHTNELIEQSS